MNRSTISEHEIYVNPGLRGHGISPSMLTSKSCLSLAEFNEVVSLSNENLTKFVEVRSPGFHLLIARLGNDFVIERNGSRLELNIPFDCIEHSPQTLTFTHLKVIFQWQENELKIGAIIHLHDKDTGLTDIFHRPTVVISTPPIEPPNALVKFVRLEHLKPEGRFNLKEEFFDAALSSFNYISQRLGCEYETTMFWDGSNKASKVPRKETEAARVLRTLLSDRLFAKGIEILPEPEVPGGKTDFVLVANVQSEIHKITVEVKDAHSSNLVHGVQKQLPEYLRRQRSDFGIYCVLFYGDAFGVQRPVIEGIGTDPPAELDECSKAQWVMAIAARNASAPAPVKTVLLNVGQPTNPSKL